MLFSVTLIHCMRIQTEQAGHITYIVLKELFAGALFVDELPRKAPKQQLINWFRVYIPKAVNDELLVQF